MVATLQVLETKKIETDLGSYGIRKNPDKLEIYDLSALPKEFIKIKEEKEPDKDKIKAYIREYGGNLTERNNLWVFFTNKMIKILQELKNLIYGYESDFNGKSNFKRRSD